MKNGKVGLVQATNDLATGGGIEEPLAQLGQRGIAARCFTWARTGQRMAAGHVRTLLTACR